MEFWTGLRVKGLGFGVQARGVSFSGWTAKVIRGLGSEAVHETLTGGLHVDVACKLKGRRPG